MLTEAKSSFLLDMVPCEDNSSANSFNIKIQDDIVPSNGLLYQ